MIRLRNAIAIGAALAVAPIVFSSTAAMAATSTAARGPASHRVPSVPSRRRGPNPPVAVRALTHLGGVSHYAFVERSTVARSTPSGSGKPVGVLHAETFWETSTIVLTLAQTTGRAGHIWTEVRLAQRPNNVTGWVPSSTLSTLHAVDTWLRVDRETFTATLIRDGRVVFQAPIGVGQPQWPTPTGQFFVEESLTPPDSGSLYGPLAFGTSAHSGVLTEWPNEGQIGIHGTNEPWLIPGRISHGCIRLHNEDILRLARLMPVGTPITIT